jgi:hypothetical protein
MKTILLLFALCFSMTVGFAQLPTTVVEAEGVAETGTVRERAIQRAVRDAQMRAIEQVCGVRLVGVDVGGDFQLKQSAQVAYAQGVVLKWERMGEPKFENRLVRVPVRAWVVPLSSIRTPNDWREVWQTIGHPSLSLSVQYEGEATHKSLVVREARDHLKTALQAMGVELGAAGASPGWILQARVRVKPISEMGNPNAPYGIDNVAGWKAELTLNLMEPSVQQGKKIVPGKTHPLGTVSEIAASFSSDEEAIRQAVQHAIEPKHGVGWRLMLSEIWIQKLLTETE